MAKAFLVSGIKNGKEKAWAFRNYIDARAKMNNVEFQKGWKNLGISEIENYREAKRLENFLNK